MGVVYYKYKSAKETYSVPLPYSFISVYELKQLILTSNRHGQGRTRGRGPREDIAISNAQTGEEYADENAMIPQNVTVMVRRIAGQLSENIVLVSSRKVIEDGSIASNKSVVTESTSKSCSSAEVPDEDASIAAELKWLESNIPPLREDQPSKRGQASGRFTSGHLYGHGPLEGEAPPPGYVCRSCGVPGHFIQYCTKERQIPPPGYTCYRCRVPGHFIHHCPSMGDPKLDNYKMSRSLAPVVASASPVDGIPSALAPAASVSVIDNLPPELHCQICNKVMTDAMLTSKCCFDSFCDKCIRTYIIAQSKCVCGIKALADDLIPNHTLRSTINNMLVTMASSAASDTGNHRSSSGSNPDPKSQGHAPAVALQRVMEQSVDYQLSSATPDKVAIKDEQVNQPQENSAVNNGLENKDGGENSARESVEKSVPSADVLKQKDTRESSLKDTNISGTLELKTARADQPKKKRKKADPNKIAHPNVAGYDYNIPFDPAYCNPYHGGYPWVTEPYLYGSLGMPYGGYPMGPYGVNSVMNMLPQPLAMQGYPTNYQSWETQSILHRDAEAAARARQTERPNDFNHQSRLSEQEKHLNSLGGTESRNKSRSRPERRESDHDSRSDRASNDYGLDRHNRMRDHGRSDRASIGYNEDRHCEKDHGRSDRTSSDHNVDHHSRKRMRVSSPMDGDKSRRMSRHSSRTPACDDSSDDERNFKRSWGRRSSVNVGARS